MSELVEITPPAYRCGDIAPTCPAVFEVGSEKLIVIGKAVSHDALQGRVGPDEMAVEIPHGLVAGLFMPDMPGTSNE